MVSLDSQAVLVNGGAPGPLITANKGDEFNLNVIDSLTNETMLLSSTSKLTTAGPTVSPSSRSARRSLMAWGGSLAARRRNYSSVITVTSASATYRMRLVSMSCDSNFTITIDSHTMTIQRQRRASHCRLYSNLCDIGNYWIRSVANGGTAGFDNGINSAILRYETADEIDPTTNQTASAAALVETDLRPLVASTVAETPEVGGADVVMNLVISLDFATFTFEINGLCTRHSTLIARLNRQEDRVNTRGEQGLVLAHIRLVNFRQNCQARIVGSENGIFGFQSGNTGLRCNTPFVS
ncbi:hypothetical protein C8F01DRAFT_1259739 [Mycena amicta]|nr:hypothetical protein C8F01DRAFT_1259739 [Mycena amicta]